MQIYKHRYKTLTTTNRQFEQNNTYTTMKINTTAHVNDELDKEYNYAIRDY